MLTVIKLKYISVIETYNHLVANEVDYYSFNTEIWKTSTSSSYLTVVSI